MSHLQASLGGWTLSTGIVVLCLLGSLLLSVVIVFVTASLHRPWRLAARQLALALLVPGVVLAVRPEWLSNGQDLEMDARVMSLVLGVLPLLVLPVLTRLAGMLDGQIRAASGLGAGRIAILRLVWLPQLGPAVLMGGLLAGLLDLAALAPRH